MRWGLAKNGATLNSKLPSYYEAEFISMIPKNLVRIYCQAWSKINSDLRRYIMSSNNKEMRAIFHSWQ